MAAKYGGDIVRKGLIINCDAGNPKSYPGTGTNWYNLAAPQFDTSNTAAGVMNGGVTWSAGPPASMVFSSASSGIVTFGVGNDLFSDTNVWNNPHEMTLEFWCKSSGLGAGMTLGGLVGFTYGIRCYYSGTGAFQYSFDNGVDLNTGSDSGSNFDGNWHHVIMTTMNAGCDMYVDGVLKNHNTRRWFGKTRWGTNTINLGRDNNNTPYYLEGNIAIFRVYKKWFALQDALQNFNALRGRFGV